jgi:hypothetical protein
MELFSTFGRGSGGKLPNTFFGGSGFATIFICYLLFYFEFYDFYRLVVRILVIFFSLNPFAVLGFYG